MLPIQGRRRGNCAAHGTIARWNAGCSCAQCRQFQCDTAKARFRRKAQRRLPAEVRQQLLDAIYSGQPFRQILRELGVMTSSPASGPSGSRQVWGLTRTDPEWSDKLEAALTATRRDDLEHGTNAAYVGGCVCSECRTHQRVRMAQNRTQLSAT
jgi:hypothetical protein